MRLHIGCGSDGGTANAFSENELLGNANHHEPIHLYPSKLATHGYPEDIQNGEAVPLNVILHHHESALPLCNCEGHHSLKAHC